MKKGAVKLWDFIKVKVKGLGSTPVAPHSAWVFRQGIYLILLINTLVLLPISDQLWGPDSYMLRFNGSFNPIFDLVGLLLKNSVVPYYKLFIGAQLILLLLGVFRLWPWLTAIFVYLISLNLFYKGIELSNGGYHLIALELFYLVFLALTPLKSKKTIFTWFRNTVSNLAFWAIWVQISILYGTAGFYKLSGDLWTGGQAMYYVLSVAEYSHPWAMDSIPHVGWLLVIFNYIVLAYQIVFPFLIWFKRWRPLLLLVGFLFHMSIFLIVGITDFGIIMLVSYLIFLPEKRAKKWLETIRRRLPSFMAYALAPEWEEPGEGQ